MKLFSLSVLLLGAAEAEQLNLDTNADSYANLYSRLYSRLHSRSHAHSRAHSRLHSRAHLDADDMEGHNSRKSALEESEYKLSQSIMNAFQMDPPKLMNSPNVDLPKENGVFLTEQGTNGAFLDGWYVNTTRSESRNEMQGREAQNYLYMWKHACAYTKWVPSNQFMYSGLDYNPEQMTLERFGFIGMDKKCFWGSIGVLWKRPLPVEQILPGQFAPESLSKKVQKKEEPEEVNKAMPPPPEDKKPDLVPVEEKPDLKPVENKTEPEVIEQGPPPPMPERPIQNRYVKKFSEDRCYQIVRAEDWQDGHYLSFQYNTEKNTNDMWVTSKGEPYTHQVWRAIKSSVDGYFKLQAVLHPQLYLYADEDGVNLQRNELLYTNHQSFKVTMQGTNTRSPTVTLEQPEGYGFLKHRAVVEKHNDDLEAQRLEVWPQESFDASEQKATDLVMAQWKILELIKCPKYA